jgi:TolB protein
MLQGSLPEGEHTVRFLCYVVRNNEWFKTLSRAAVMSNPVKVQGKAGGACSADLAKLKAPVAFVERPDSGAAQKAGALDKSALKGEIWFDSNREGNWDIFVMNADGTNVRNVTNTKDKDEFDCRPSPDGKRVAYVVGKIDPGPRGAYIFGRWANQSPKWELWVSDRDGKNAKKIADKANRPDWSPDSKAVVYSGPTSKEREETTYVQVVDTGKIAEPLKKAEKWIRGGTGAAFAPNSRKMLCGGKLWTSTGVTLFVADLDESYEFKSFKPVMTTYQGCTPRWSADGERIYFAHHDPKYKGGIVLWSIKADGTDAKRFETPTNKCWPGYEPICESPDGTMVAYCAGGEIHVQRVADGADVALTAKQGANAAPRWHKGAAGP